MDPQSLLADGDFVRALARSLIADSHRADAVPSAAEVAEREAARRAVVEELMTLEETYRAVLLLRFYYRG
jgi:DNA-directed RNA polymerase specialized sigma24 family protein